jgi:hypothetical protein
MMILVLHRYLFSYYYQTLIKLSLLRKRRPSRSANRRENQLLALRALTELQLRPSHPPTYSRMAWQTAGPFCCTPCMFGS